jgi:hypothetical protein
MKKLSSEQMYNINGASCILTFAALPYMVLLGVGLPNSYKNKYYSTVSDCWNS